MRLKFQEIFEEVCQLKNRVQAEVNAKLETRRCLVSSERQASQLHSRVHGKKPWFSGPGHGFYAMVVASGEIISWTS